MSASEFKMRLEAALVKKGIEGAEVTLRADLDGGWMIRVVASAFAEMNETERRQSIADAVDKELVSWRQLLTPEEIEGAIPMPAEESSVLPLWPESLARGSRQVENKELVAFLSDTEEELEPPITVTFYSLRGGVGRSTSLAHTARLLASQGKKVVCLDMDLEAPGLAALFNVEASVERGMGVVELLMQLDQGFNPDFSRHLVPVGDDEQLFLIPPACRMHPMHEI
ncbi:P-loop NTPase [Cobetia marina]